MRKSYTCAGRSARLAGVLFLMTACDNAEMGPNTVVEIDHLLYLAPTREQGMDEIEALLGVRPAVGGRHPLYGTHNALLSLGDGIYFEVIARDPELPEPERGALFDSDNVASSRLITWVARTDDMEAVVAAAREAGLGLGAAEPGHRDRPDGTRVEWLATDPYPLPMDGAIPFLIDWGNTTHPSTVAKPGGELLSLTIEHPQADAVRDAMAVLGADIEVVEADEYALVARIRTASGVVELR